MDGRRLSAECCKRESGVFFKKTTVGGHSCNDGAGILV